MTLRRLAVKDFRNLVAIDIELSSQLNIFYGDNGSGKTSLLEAISVLSLGRSFRSRKFKNTINRNAESYTVFGNVYLPDRITHIPIGVQRSQSSEVQIKKGGLNCTSASELAATLPIRVIDGHSFLLLEGGPQARRQFLDWLVFHVEHEFYGVWRAYEKCLKQRNSLLRRDKIDHLSLSSWDIELAELGEKLHRMRKRAFNFLIPVYEELTYELSGLNEVSLNYYGGWDDSINLKELFESTRERDADLGYTRQGPHRADIKITVGSKSIAALDVLSRGQQKVVTTALLVAEGKVFQETQDRQCLFLIDDLPAELDAQFRKTLAGWLSTMDCQICVTGIEKEVLLDAWKDYKDIGIDTRVFHVEHGKVEVSS